MLALIAGKGALPVTLADALTTAGTPFRVLSLEGYEPDLPDVISFRVEALGKVLSDLAEAGVTEVCFAGAMHRPPIDVAKLHPLSLPLVPRLMAVLQHGDDRLLREVIAIFEEAGLKVRGAHDLAPDLVVAEGVVCGSPTDTDLTDAARGKEILATLGTLDIGQGCVVAGGQCLGVETLQGTDAMLGFVAQSRAAVSPPPGGVFIKRAKPDQDLRIDMPAIGPETVSAAKAAGLSGISVQAGHVLILDKSEVITAARNAGLSLWSMP
ncbi:LpxI family protein [Tropicimonas sp. S265A]|uniref:LpxI family protein n=1 Tax=Tropicimonas sp. S265A TaxID=3415134 RepID=UPI003C7E9832